jgi:hypothetical protein
VRRRPMAWSVKVRPIPPRSPHLNGKIERAQQTRPTTVLRPRARPSRQQHRIGTQGQPDQRERRAAEPLGVARARGRANRHG